MWKYYLTFGAHYFKNTTQSIKNGKGIVKFFNETKGFGFIKMSSSDKEVFGHRNWTERKKFVKMTKVFDLREGKKV